MVCSAALPVGFGSSTSAQAATTVQRLSGSDRFATAAELSRANFAAGVRVAYVTTGYNFPDALATAPLAAKTGGPVLLVAPGSIPAATRTELSRLRPQRIVIVGGPSTVSTAVASALGAYTAGAVSRIHGADRFATAAAVSRSWGKGVSAVYIATGRAFPDALAASAAAARGRFPVLLVERDSIPASVRTELARLNPQRIYIAGGAGVVSEGVRRALDAYTAGAVERVAGVDRYATAAQISRRHFGSAPVAYLATGLNYPDALASAAVAGIRGGPVLLSAPTSLPRSVSDELKRLKPGRVTVVGGRAALSEAILNAVKLLFAPVPVVSPTPILTPKPAPTAPPAPTAAPVPPAPGGGGSSASRCPVAMPATAPAGWTRATTSTFSETTPLGSWPGPVAAAQWKNRQAGAKDSSGRGTYDSSRTVSEGNGLLDIWIHSEVSGKPGVHDPAGQRYVAAIVSKLGATKGARISICMRADTILGYKLAYLLWPSSGSGNQLGEIDYPEGKLTGLPATAHAFMHYAPKPSSGKHQDWYDSLVALQGWHAYTIEWNPKASTPYAKFFIDGRLIGHSTNYVPTVTMTYIMQNETYVGGQALPAPAQGHIQVDWLTIDLP